MKNIKRTLAILFSFAITFSALFVNEAYTVNASGNTIAENAIYVAPGATGTGSYDNPMDFESALLAVNAGQTIYMLEGTYKYANTITIAAGNDGTKDNYKTLSAYPGAKVVIDFSAQPCKSSNRGIILDGNYWHFYGITIYGAGDNGMLLAGDYNLIEMCIFENNQDTGLQLSRNNNSNSVADWPSYNYILNCTSRNNHDPDGEDADGFAPKLTCGEGNVFDGCLAYNNVDDGWDCYAKPETGPIGKVTIINCIAFRNGQTEDGTFTANSDGNGFKLGGGGIGTPHTVINCLSFENKNCGFVDNNNPTALTLINCTAFNNNLAGKKYSFNVYRCKDANCINIVSYSNSSSKDTFQNTFGNYILYYNKGWFKVDSYMALDSKNSSKCGEKVNIGLQASDFVVTESPAIGTDFHTLWRNADGSLNTHGYAMISPNSTYATFATDGKAAGARFGSEKSDYFTPANVEMIKSASIGTITKPETPAETTTAAPETTTAETTTAAPETTTTETTTVVPETTTAETTTTAPETTTAETTTTAPETTTAETTTSAPETTTAETATTAVPETTTTAPATTVTTVSTDNGLPENLPLITVACIAAVIAIGTVIVLLIIKKRK